MTDSTEKEALEDLLNKVDYEGGWDGFFQYGYDPESYPGLPARVLEDISWLNKMYQDLQSEIDEFEADLLKEYEVSL